MSFSFSASVASRPAVLKRGSFASRARARTACRASALPQKGKTALTGVLRVPTASEAAFDELWASHEKMMNATHVVGNAEASDEGHPRLLEYYVSKAVELTDPFDPASAPTGNLLYCVNEKYVDPAGLGEHMSIGEKEWAGFPRLMDAIGRYAPFMTTNGVILTNYSDDIEPCTARKGDVTINLGILVPASMEADVDALWATHEKFMRDTHQFGEFPPADDLKRPRITQFTIVKAPELKDPLDPSKGTTGKIQYSMQETYCTADGIKGHFALREQYPKMFDAIMPLVSEYGVYADLGQGLVITAMEKPSFVSNVVGGLGNFLDKALPRRAPHEEFCEDYCPEEW